MRRSVLAGTLCFAVCIVTTWPWALDPTRVLGARDLEAGDHLWALWLGSIDGPLVARTAMVGAPEGYTWVIGDPAHVPLFAVGHAVGGSGFGLGLVHALALALASLAGWAWARHLWPKRPDAAVLAAPIAAAAPGLGMGLVTGMTEAQPLGLTALALLALHALARDGGGRRAAACSLAFGLLPWFGAYPALYGILLAPLVAGWGLAQGTGRWRRVALIAAAAAAAGLVAAPVLDAVLTIRDPGLPGGTPLTTQVLTNPDLPRNRMLGADLVGLLLPGGHLRPTGIHGAYLGLGMVLAACAGTASRVHRRWLPLVLAFVAAMLALGFTLQAGGGTVRLGEAPLLAPAGVLSLAIDGLGRAPRWTRMATLASILLAPMAGAGLDILSRRGPTNLRGGIVAVGLGLIVADATALGPAPFPRPTFSAAPPPALLQLPTTGSLLEVPTPRFSSMLPETGGGPRARIRHPTLIWQTGHGRPLSGNPHQASSEDGSGARLGARLLSAAHARDIDAVTRARSDASRLGFSWVVSWRGLSTDRDRAALVNALGPPSVDDATVVAWSIVAP